MGLLLILMACKYGHMLVGVGILGIVGIGVDDLVLLEMFINVCSRFVFVMCGAM